jgi:hypothetical protein
MAQEKRFTSAIGRVKAVVSSTVPMKTPQAGTCQSFAQAAATRLGGSTSTTGGRCSQMHGTRAKRRRETESDRLTIHNSDVISWFTSLDTDPQTQDEWVQDVTGRESAVVVGYSIQHKPLKLEIEYEYIAVGRP